MSRPLLAALVLLLVAAAPARAADRTLAPVTNDSPLSAHDGWVAWSEVGPDGLWHLVTWHMGTKAIAPVAPRSVPYDVDLGTDAAGRTVATYSRCAAEPGPLTPNDGYASPNGVPRWIAARGCGIRVLDLTTGTETSLRAKRPAGASDTTPSMWRGRVAFARLAKGARVAQVEVFDPASNRVRRLRHGAMQAACSVDGRCDAGAPGQGWVQQLDLGARAVAFVWEVRANGVLGAGDGWELRADRLPDGTSRVFGSGYQSGACGARYPLSPAVTSRGIWFDELRWICDVPHSTPVFGDLRSGLVGRGTEVGPQVAWQTAWDGTTMYSIRGTGRAASGLDTAPCTGAIADCRLIAAESPPTPRTDRRGRGAFIF